MNRHYAVLCDYGLDDACATVYLLDNAEEGDRFDILPIGGNSEVNVAYRNAQTLIAEYVRRGGSADNVRIVDTCDVTQPWAMLPSIHGKDGMGDLFAPAVSSVPVIDFADWLNENTDPLYVVSLGPCTVTDIIMKKVRVENLLIMGGCVAEVPNFHGYEFNHYLDIPAFNACTKYPHAVATLDSCRTPKFNLAGKHFTDGSLLSKLLDRSIELAMARHPDNCYVYDYIAVHYAVNPDLFMIEKVVDGEGNLLSELKVK